MNLPSILKFKLPKLPKFLKLDLTKKSTVIIIFLILFATLVWMWWLGPNFVLFGIRPFEVWLYRLLISIVLLSVMFGWTIFLVVKHVKKLLEEKEEQEENQVDIEIEQQQNYLNNCLLQIQKRLMVKNFRYKLPWYLVIGEQNSGKSSLIKQSCKLNELYPSNDAQHVNCYFNEQAIIIEADGELFETSSSGDKNLWQSLLDWLVIERSHQPLNGIILTVDIYKLCTFTKHEQEAYIAKIEAKLNDIIQTLHNKLPIYLVLTKLDLLYGFESFYKDLDKKQRDEMLGVSFKISNQDDWRLNFELFWKKWVKQLNDSLPSMMLENTSKRSQLFTFVRQANGIKHYIYQLVDGISYAFRSQPIILRGIYLVSSLQKGQMEDLFVQSATALYNLPEQVYPSWQTPKSYPYFSYNLFHTILFKEAHLAGVNQHYKKKNNNKLLGVGFVSTVFCVSILFGWHYYYLQNSIAGKKLLIKTQEYVNTNPLDQNDYFGDLQLPLLNPIGEATMAYGNYHKHNKLFSNLGLYQGYKVVPYVESIYLQVLLQRFLPAIMNGLKLDLDNAENGSDQKLQILRIMRMIEDETGRDKNMVVQYMLSRWSEQFKGQNDIQNQLHQHLSYALDHVQWKKQRGENNKLAIDAYLPFVQSIKKAQLELSYNTIYQRVYQNIRSQSEIILPSDLNIKNQIGASFDAVFRTEDENKLYIPQLLTRSGLINYFIVQDKNLIELTALDSWALDITSHVNYSDADRKEIELKITELYLNDYVGSWSEAYNNIHIKAFTDIGDAIYGLEQIIGNEQLFKKTFSLLQENTTPKESTLSSKLDEVGDKAGAVVDVDLLKSRDYQLLNYLNNEFKKDTDVIVENDEKDSELQNVNNKLIDLHRYLMAISSSPSSGKAALAAVLQHVRDNASNPIFEAQQLAKTLPPLSKRFIFELTDEIWNVVMLEALKSLEDEWVEKVINPYQQYFVNRYPFNLQAKIDVPLSEFERFFGYDGILDSFYQQNLKAFVENNLKINESGRQIVSQEVLRQLGLADKIRRIYFNKHQGLGISFSLQPLTMSGNRRSGILNLDGQLVEYKHAKSSAVRLIWPNSMRDNITSRLSLNGAGDRSKILVYNGQWGLIRLINAGKLTNINHNSFDVRYDIDGSYIIYRIFTDEADNPFAGGLFNQFSLPYNLH